MIQQEDTDKIDDQPELKELGLIVAQTESKIDDQPDQIIVAPPVVLIDEQLDQFVLEKVDYSNSQSYQLEKPEASEKS